MFKMSNRRYLFNSCFTKGKRYKGIKAFAVLIFIAILSAVGSMNTVYAGEAVGESLSNVINSFPGKILVEGTDKNGVLALVTVKDNTYWVDYGSYETKTDTKQAIDYYTGSSTNIYEYDGSSWVFVSNYSGTDTPSIAYNKDGYVGTLYRGALVDQWSNDSPPSNPEEGDTYSKTTYYKCQFTGDVTKTWQEWVSDWQKEGTYDAAYQGILTTHAEKNFIIGETEKCVNIGEPVNIITGNYYSTDIDLTLNTRGLPLTVKRYYNSLDASTGIMGKSWHFEYDSSLTEDATTGNVTITFPDAHRTVFQPISGTNTYTAPATVFDRLVKNADATYTLELENKLTYTYNSNKKLSSISDRNGNTIIIQYNAQNQITTITGAGGQALSVAYLNGMISTITDSSGRTITYNYASGQISSVTGISGTTHYSYNTYGITSITDENGKTFINNIYDEFGRVVRQTDEENNVTLFTYDEANMENTYTVVATGATTKYRYNVDQYITRITYGDNTYEEYTYDQDGNKTSVRNRNGRVFTYTYDAKGNVLTAKEPAPFNNITNFTYDANSNLIKIVTPGGSQTEFEYDINSNLKKIKVKIDETNTSETNYSYDSYGRILSITDAENHTTTYQYDDALFSQPTKLIDASNNEISFTYDALGRMNTITTEYGTTTYEYNNLDKITKITDPSNNISRMKYDSVGNLIKLISPEQYNDTTDDGAGFTYQYDAMDRLTNITDPLGNVTAQKYDAEGRKIKEINPNFYNQSTGDGTGISYEYDSSGRLIKITNPSGQKSRIFYDGVGNIIKTIDANNYNEATDTGAGTEYTYDELNRLVQMKDAQGNIVARYVYDLDGRIIKAIDAKGYASATSDDLRYGTIYKYNLIGWVKEKRIPLKTEGGTIYYNASQYEYDKTGKVTKEKKSAEYVTQTGVPTIWNEIEYQYDLLGRVIKITDSTGAEIEYQYDALGNTLQEKAKINDTTYKITGYHYDSLGRLDKQWSQIDSSDLSGEYPVNPETGKVHAETSYQYDKNNNLIAITSPEGYSVTYEYDASNRLVKVNKVVTEDQIEITRNTAAITANKKIVYPTVEYQYGVQIEAQEGIAALDMTINYDARSFELISAHPIVEGVTINTDTIGAITLTASEQSLNGAVLTGTVNLAGLSFKVKDGIKGIGYITISSDSSYTDNNAQNKSFTVLSGKANMINQPDMNKSDTVETDDFTLTSLLKDKVLGDMAFEDKYDIDASGVIDLPDLNYIKDWLFEQPKPALNPLEIQQFIQSTTNATYTQSASLATRTTTYVYDKAGNIVKEMDCNGNEVTYQYDAYNRVTIITDKEGNKSKLVYDEVGNVIKEVKPENYNTSTGDGVGTQYSYDALNRLQQITDETGIVIQRMVYNSYGELVKQIDAAGYASASTDTTRYGIEYTYDIGGRVISIITPEAKTKAVTSVRYIYDALSNVLTQTDGEDNTTTYTRDLWGKVTQITDANNINTHYTYDYAGNITSTTDGNSNTTHYYYNSMNLRSKMTDPMGQDVLYNYDLEGRLTKEIDRNGQEIVYSYNSDSNLILKNAVGGTGTEPTTPEGQGTQGLYQKYLYNLDGSLLAAINSENVDKYLYTANGNLYQKYHNGQLEIEYGYNKNGSISRVKDKTNAETNYTYDTIGRLKTVKDGLQQLAQYNYNVDSTINQIIYNTGVNVSYNYDRDKNITSLINKNQQGNIISDFIYTYDNNGNQKSKTENGEATNYTYDKLNRLEAVQYPTAGIESYTYDNAGNRLSKTTQNTVGGMTTLDITTTYVYDALNRMTESQAYDIILSSKTKTTYSYDGNGNLLTEATTKIDPQTGLPLPQIDQNTGQTLTDPITGQPLVQQPQIKKYTYNAFNQTTSITNPDGSFQQNFYDALGMRIGIVENGVRSDFIFDRGSIIAEFDGSGTLTNRNIRGYGLIAQKDTKGRLNYYLHNAHGDVTSLINPAGEILNTYNYDAFGNTTSYVETVTNRFRYAGEQLDEITGQYYLRARYYDPQVGRFTQEDTYRGDGLNLYAYVANNPVNFVDPSGYAKCHFEEESSLFNRLVKEYSSNKEPDISSIVNSFYLNHYEDTYMPKVKGDVEHWETISDLKIDAIAQVGYGGIKGGINGARLNPGPYVIPGAIVGAFSGAGDALLQYGSTPGTGEVIEQELFKAYSRYSQIAYTNLRYFIKDSEKRKSVAEHYKERMQLTQEIAYSYIEHMYSIRKAVDEFSDNISFVHQMAYSYAKVNEKFEKLVKENEFYHMVYNINSNPAYEKSIEDIFNLF